MKKSLPIFKNGFIAPFVLIFLAIICAFVALTLLFNTFLLKNENKSVPNSATQPSPSTSSKPNGSIETTNTQNKQQIDYYSCADLEKLPFQLPPKMSFAVGYLQISGTVEVIEETGFFFSKEKVKAVYIRIPPQTPAEGKLFYSQFRDEAEGSSANAKIDGKDLLLRLGAYSQNGIFSSTASVPSNFQAVIDKAIQNRGMVNLLVVISIPGGTEAPSNTSGACKMTFP